MPRENGFENKRVVVVGGSSGIGLAVAEQVLALGGVGFVIRNFALVLAPDVFLLPAMIAMLALILWFLIRGVNVRKWDEKAAASDLDV